jgi:uncharacterized Zn finger protein
MCKHIAAALYGIGARLDVEPQLLFGLRKVDARELIAKAGAGDALTRKTPRTARLLDPSKLADVFGIDLPGVEPKSAATPPARTGVKRRRPSGSGKSKTAAAPRARSVSRTAPTARDRTGR